MLSNGVLGLGYEGPDLVPARTREQALLSNLDRKLSSFSPWCSAPSYSKACLSLCKLCGILATSNLSALLII